MNLEEYISQERDEITKARINAFKNPGLLPHANIFNDIIEYDGKTSGKLLRPLLCVLVSDALDGEHAEAVHVAAAIELVHAGSLVHDDIVDEDELRHGQDTIWKKFGNKAGVLFGDMLFVASAASTQVLPDKHMVTSFHEIMDIYGRASSGAMMEGNRNPWNQEEYLNVVKLKTAGLFRGAARLGCITANASSATMSIMSDWAEDIGTAFQIEDDIADIRKSIQQKEPIGDVKEGKVTLPVMYLKEKYSSALEKQCKIYVNGVEKLDDIAGMVAMFPEAITFVEHYVEEILFKAKPKLDLIPFKNGFKDMLQNYGTYIINSMRREQ